jgi:predicted ATPase
MSDKAQTISSEKGTTLIGRENERKMILSALNRAAEGRGSMILLEGEAGIGKTHLLRECSADARNLGFSVLWGKCLHYRNSPHLPFIDMLREKFGITTLEDYETNRERVRGKLGDNPLIKKGLLNDFSDLFIPKDEPVGGYCLPEDRKTHLLEYLKEKGYRVLILREEGRVEEVTTDNEIIWIGQDENRSIPPGRMERIARILKESYSRYRHLAVVNEVMDLLLFNNPEEKVGSFISVVNDMALKNSGLVAHLHDGNDQLLSSSKDFKIHLKKNGDRSEGENGSPSTIRMSVNDLFTNFIEGESEKKPQLVVIEDLQWADKPSLNLLQYLARNVNDERLVILGSYRPEEYSLEEDELNKAPLRDALQRISRERLFDTIDLTRFDRIDQERMARSLTEEEISQENLKKMERETEGNPLLIKQFIEEQKKKRPSNNGDVFAKVESDAISRRLQNLDERTREMLNLASVLGLECSLDMIVTGLEMDEEEALDRLDSLIEIRLVLESEEGLRFEHPKTRAIIYESIPEDKVSSLHSIAANLIESTTDFKGSCKVMNLAEHYERGGDHSRAYRAYIESAEEMIERMRGEEALKALKSSLKCMKRLDSSRERDIQMVRVLQMIGDVHENSGNTREALIHFKEAVDIAEKGDIPYGQSSSYRRIGDIMLKLFEWDQTVDYYLRSLHVSKKEDDQEEVAKAFRGLGIIYYLKGDYTRSMDCYLKYMDFPKKEKKPLNVLALVEVGNIYFEMGDFNQALTYFKLAIRKGEESDLKQESALAYVRMSSVLMKLRELEDSKRFAQWGFNMVKEHVSSEITQKVVLEYIELMMESGEMQKANDGVSILEKIPERELGDRLLKGHKHRTMGLLLSKGRRFDEAKEHLDKALEINRSLQVPFQLGLTCLYYGLVLFQQMKVEDAMEMLKQASSTFKSINALYYLNRTSSKLRELTFIKEGMSI